ncbi:hypothetical protein Tco_1236491 [Tanacetum coccineum]
MIEGVTNEEKDVREVSNTMDTSKEEATRIVKGELVLVRRGQTEGSYKDCMLNEFSDGRSSTLEGCFFSFGVVVLLGMMLWTEGHSNKRSKIALVKFRWNSKRGPEFTWERKDQMRSKCPQLFVDSDIASSS